MVLSFYSYQCWVDNYHLTQEFQGTYNIILAYFEGWNLLFNT